MGGKCNTDACDSDIFDLPPIHLFFSCFFFFLHPSGMISLNSMLQCPFVVPKVMCI